MLAGRHIVEGIQDSAWGLGWVFLSRSRRGLRMRASSRGIRTSIGPRAARVHVGGGRTGFSTGVAGQFYTSGRACAGRRVRTQESVDRGLAAPGGGRAEGRGGAAARGHLPRDPQRAPAGLPPAQRSIAPPQIMAAPAGIDTAEQPSPAHHAADAGIAVPGGPVYSCSPMHPGHGSTGTSLPSWVCAGPGRVDLGFAVELGEPQCGGRAHGRFRNLR
jgi:hypothetical protein